MEKLPKLLEPILIRKENGQYSTSRMVYHGHGDGPWRPWTFDAEEPVDWVPLPTVDDKRWRPYRYDTKWNEEVLCLGRFTDSPNPNIHIDSTRDDPFPGFMGKMPPMWGVSHWMPLEEALQGSFKLPKSFLDLPTYWDVRNKEAQQEEDQAVDDLFLAVTNDGDMYRQHFSNACDDGELVDLGRAKRPLIGWRAHDKELQRGFRHWMDALIRKYNAKHGIFKDFIDNVYSRVTTDLLDHYENIAIETAKDKVHV